MLGRSEKGSTNLLRSQLAREWYFLCQRIPSSFRKWSSELSLGIEQLNLIIRWKTWMPNLVWETGTDTERRWQQEEMLPPEGTVLV